MDGHSVEELCKVLSQPRHQPLAIIAKTIKGKGIPGTAKIYTNEEENYNVNLKLPEWFTDLIRGKTYLVKEVETDPDGVRRAISAFSLQ